jgi:hypothetical protein
MTSWLVRGLPRQFMVMWERVRVLLSDGAGGGVSVGVVFSLR